MKLYFVRFGMHGGSAKTVQFRSKSKRDAFIKSASAYGMVVLAEWEDNTVD